MTNARTKAVFGGLAYEDAEVLVKDIFPGDNLDLQEWKPKLTKPTIVGYVRAWFQSFAEGFGQTSGSADGMQRGSGGARGVSTSRTFSALGLNQEIVNSMAESFVDSYFDSVSSSYSQADSFSRIEGKSEGLEPVFEDLPIVPYSLQEQIHRAIGRMVQQPQRHAIIKLPNQNPQFIETPWIVDPYVSEPRLEAAKKVCFVNSQVVKSVQEVTKEIAEREKKMFELAKPRDARKEDPKTFREAEKIPKDEPTKYRS
jgi:hypothetical protein